MSLVWWLTTDDFVFHWCSIVETRLKKSQFSLFSGRQSLTSFLEKVSLKLILWIELYSLPKNNHLNVIHKKKKTQNKTTHLKSKHIREVIKWTTYYSKISIFIKGIKIERCTASNILSSPGHLSCSSSKG